MQHTHMHSHIHTCRETHVCTHMPGHADSTHMDRDLGTRDTDMYVMDLGEQAHRHGHMNMWTHRHTCTRALTRKCTQSLIGTCTWALTDTHA